VVKLHPSKEQAMQQSRKKIKSSLLTLIMTCSCTAAMTFAVPSKGVVVGYQDNLRAIYSAIMAQAKINYSTDTSEGTQIEGLANKLIASKKEKKKNTSTSSTNSLICDLDEQFKQKTTTLCGKNHGPEYYQTQYLYNKSGEPQKFPSSYNMNDSNFADIVANKYNFYDNWFLQVGMKGDGKQSAKISIFSNYAYKPKNRIPDLTKYLSMYLSSVATRSIAISTLKQIANEEKEDNNAELLKQISSSAWTNNIKNAGPLTIQKEQLMLLTQMVKLQTQDHIDSERSTAVMSALLLKINSLTDFMQLATLKNNLSKKLDNNDD
jgi:hypothetical protein